MESPPHIGMTKSQVRAKYGDPKTRDVSDEGEPGSTGSILARRPSVA